MEHENKTTPVSVPYVVFRDAQAHSRWVIRTLAIALIATVVLMFGSNAIWLYAWMQYDYGGEETVTTVDSEGDGIATYNYAGNDGSVVYGEGYRPQEDVEANSD